MKQPFVVCLSTEWEHSLLLSEIYEATICGLPEHWLGTQFVAIWDIWSNHMWFAWALTRDTVCCYLRYMKQPYVVCLSTGWGHSLLLSEVYEATICGLPEHWLGTQFVAFWDIWSNHMWFAWALAGDTVCCYLRYMKQPYVVCLSTDWGHKLTVCCYLRYMEQPYVVCLSTGWGHSLLLSEIYEATICGLPEHWPGTQFVAIWGIWSNHMWFAWALAGDTVCRSELTMSP